MKNSKDAAQHAVSGAKNFISGFKAFIGNKNVMNMAIGVVIAQTFGKIVTSLVDDIIMPLLALGMGKADFSEIVWTLREAEGDTPAVVMNAGVFISSIINFLFVALCLFIVVKALTSAQKRMEKLRNKPEEPEQPKEPTTEEKTLAALENIESILANIAENKDSLS